MKLPQLAITLKASCVLGMLSDLAHAGPYTSDISWARKIDVDQAVFGVGVGESTATLMRTHPPSGFEDFSVDSLTYQGAYPAARLAGQVCWASLGEATHAQPSKMGLCCCLILKCCTGQRHGGDNGRILTLQGDGSPENEQTAEH